MNNDETLPRVALIGFNKCATRSFANLFEAAGHGSVHHKIRRVFKTTNIAKLIKENLDNQRKFFSGIEDYTFYGDMIYQSEQECFEAYLHFREILRDYPDSILLLNTRNREDWIRSRVNHGHGEFLARTMRAHGFKTRAECEDYWRGLWDGHLSDVRAHMADRPGQLIEFNIDTDDIAEFVKKLPQYHLDPDDWGDHGRSRNRNRSSVFYKLKKLWSHIRPRTH